MENLNDLKAIWLTAKTDSLPASDDMIRLVKGFKNGKLRTKWKVIWLSAATIVFWIVFMWFLQPSLVITWIGAGLTVMSSLILIWTNLSSMKRFHQLNDCSNKEFLAFLEQTRRNQLYYHTKTQVFGLSLSTVGIFLYLYEFVHTNLTVFMIGYVLVAAIMMFNWLYLKPKGFKEQSAKLNAIIEKLEKISNQINDDE